MNKAKLRAKLKEARTRLAFKRLEEIDRVLDAAGVPATVDRDGTPSIDPASRLKWFISRRKDVAPFEHDSKAGELTAADIWWIKLNTPFKERSGRRSK